MKNQFSIVTYFKNLGKRIDDRIDENLKHIADSSIKLPPRISIETLSQPLENKSGSYKSPVKEELSEEEILELCKKAQYWEGWYANGKLTEQDEHIFRKPTRGIHRFTGRVDGLVIEVEKNWFLGFYYRISVFKNSIELGYSFSGVDNRIKNYYLKIEKECEGRIEERQKMKRIEDENKKQTAITYAKSLVGVQ